MKNKKKVTVMIQTRTGSTRLPKKSLALIEKKPMIWHVVNRVKEIRNTPDEIINSFREYLKTTIAGKTKEDLLSWGKNQAYLALGNLLTVCANEKRWKEALRIFDYFSSSTSSFVSTLCATVELITSFS